MVAMDITGRGFPQVSDLTDLASILVGNPIAFLIAVVMLPALRTGRHALLSTGFIVASNSSKLTVRCICRPRITVTLLQSRALLSPRRFESASIIDGTKPVASNLHRTREKCSSANGSLRFNSPLVSGDESATGPLARGSEQSGVASSRPELRVDKEAVLAFGIDDSRLQLPPIQTQKKKKKSQKENKVVPPVLTLEEAREQMERRFAEIEKEHLGPKRGVATVKFLVGRKGEKLHKTVTTKLANTILNDWVYTRHAMKHGYRHLSEMNKRALAASLIRPGSTVKYDERDARISLKELFRHGKSSILEKYHAMDRKRDSTAQQIDMHSENNIARRKTLVDLGYSPEQIALEDNILLQKALRRGQPPGPNGALPEPDVASISNEPPRIRNLADRAQMEAAGYTADEIAKEEFARFRHALQRDKRIQRARRNYNLKARTPNGVTASSSTTAQTLLPAPDDSASTELERQIGWVR
jgi:hypothetical protein